MEKKKFQLGKKKQDEVVLGKKEKKKEKRKHVLCVQLDQLLKIKKS